MNGFARRLKALEGQTAPRGPQPGVIYICSVAPSPDGPFNLGPKLAYILKGPHAGTQQSCGEGESGDAFQARCRAMVEDSL
ncbi:hypothetical protein [Hyphomonas sp. GM-8P]|uniref:hypothetical protein n=1 Tax=Hyphomonas sp. GM-8P TaxID=1280945 RepID=UPI001314EA32|nr:hypothetical protein [Hyphomonas sp. GM-8P]|tara:strand:- start:3660 stop:3902 length:243 start_codon:yes stop_codon:yes gene_type:complete